MKKKRTKLAGLVLGLLAALMMAGVAQAADWPQFLGAENSQGVTQAATPKTGSEMVQRWSLATTSDSATTQGWTDVPGTPIVVGNYVYYYSSEKLRKVEVSTGKEVATAQIYGAPVNQFFINIAYGDGKIFVPCQTNNLDEDTATKGCFIRVFDANSLKQLYVTEKIAGGQMQSPIMYHDGYIVTGTYGRNSTYVGFSVKDEDTSKSNEVKQPLWVVNCDNKYGYSFCGAAYVGDYCYFAGGTTLNIVKYKTGEAATYQLGEGYNSHSTLTYSSETKRLYVPANNPEGGASIFAFEIGANGMPNAATALEWKSGTKEGGTQSSAVVYKGRLYIGGGGGTMGSLEPFHVIDAKTMKEIYSVPVQSKGSAAVSTAYATAANGYQVYIYMIPYAPVGDESEMWIIKDKQGQTKADYEVVKGIGKRQYCSQSIAVAGDGSLIWYNDAAALYCYANGSKASIPTNPNAVTDTTNSNNTTNNSTTNTTTKPSTTGTNGQVSVVVDGKQLEFDTAPYVENGRVLLPMRVIFEELGASVDYSAGKIVAKSGDVVIQLTLGSDKMLVGSNTMTLDVPAKAVGGRTLLPLRAVSEALSAQVDWNGASKCVTITR